MIKIQVGSVRHALKLSVATAVYCLAFELAEYDHDISSDVDGDLSYTLGFRVVFVTKER